MRADVLKSWLGSKGCRFDESAHQRGAGHASLTVKLGKKRSLLPLVGTHKDIDNEEIDRILQELELDPRDMPGYMIKDVQAAERL